MAEMNCDHREELANWMIENGFVTGHGDTHADLLAELGTEVARLKTALLAAQNLA